MNCCWHFWKHRSRGSDGRKRCNPCYARWLVERALERWKERMGYGFESPDSPARKALSEAVMSGDPRARELTRAAMREVKRR